MIRIHLDRDPRHLADLLIQPADVLVRHRRDGQCGMQARLEEYLVGDPVSDAGRERLVHDDALDSAAGSGAKKRGEVLAGGQGQERIEAEGRDWRVLLGRGWDEADAGEAAS